jgi:hypothetical protein
MAVAKLVQQVPTASTFDFEIHECESGAVLKKLKRQRGCVVALSFQASDQQVVDDTITLFRQVAAVRSQVLKARGEERVEALIKALVPDPPMSDTKRLQTTMQANAMNRIIHSGDLITAADISRLAGLSSRNPSAQPNRWKKAGQTFAIPFNGTDYYPLYTLDPTANYRPYKAVAEVISILTNKDAWGLAFWFASLNGYLGGKRPQDLLATKPDQIIAAAKDQIAGVQHG